MVLVGCLVVFGRRHRVVVATAWQLNVRVGFREDSETPDVKPGACILTAGARRRLMLVWRLAGYMCGSEQFPSRSSARGVRFIPRSMGQVCAALS